MARRGTVEVNSTSVTTTVSRIVRSPQFRAGYQDRLAGLRPPRFFFSEGRAGGDDWGYERGRRLGNWLVATGRQAPRISDVNALVGFYLDAEAQDALL